MGIIFAAPVVMFAWMIWVLSMQFVGEIIGLETIAAGMWLIVGFPIFLRACWSDETQHITSGIQIICDKSEKKYSYDKVQKIMFSKNTENEEKKSKKVLTLFVLLYTIVGIPFIQYFGWWSLLCHTILLVIMAMYQAAISQQCVDAYDNKQNNKNKNNISKPDGTEHIVKAIENFYSKKFIGLTYNQIIGYTIGIVLGVIFVPGWFA